MKYVLIGLLVAAGCADESSSSLLTSGMSADMAAQDNGDGTTTVTASLFDGDPIQLVYVSLGPDDTLVAKHDGDSQTMDKEQLLTLIGYVATFSNANDGDTFTVSLDRSVDHGAPSTTMTLPASFEVASLAATQSRAAMLSVSWSPTAADPMTWQAEGDCIATASGQVTTDTGALTIPPATLTLAAGSTETSCTVTLTITRSEVGSLDPAFGHGGTAQGEQVRALTFMSTP